MKVKTLCQYLEKLAPLSYQEGYDNAGLLTGDPQAKIKGVLVCLDSTEAVIEEAIKKGCNVVIAHHPIIFKGLKRLTGRTYVERVIIKAIKNNIAIYAIHTNLDNVYYKGVNSKICEQLGLTDTRILLARQNMKKLFTLVPTTHSDDLRAALFEAGAGTDGILEQASYASLGVGSVNGSGGAMVKLEVSFPADKQSQVLNALQEVHPGPLVYDIVAIENSNPVVGSGMIGRLPEPQSEKAFLKLLKEKMQVGCLKYTELLGKKVKSVAVCGGAGGFLLPQAIRQKADVFITSDYKYHEYFDADKKIVIADIGHYESEQFTIQLLQEIISEKFSTFAVYCTEVRTNPVFYL